MALLMDANSSSKAHHKCLVLCLLCKQWMASSLLPKRSALTTSVLWLRKLCASCYYGVENIPFTFHYLAMCFCRLNSKTLLGEATLFSISFCIPQSLILLIWLNHLFRLIPFLQMEGLLLVKDRVSGLFWSEAWTGWLVNVFYKKLFCQR